jgi:hypothetical protein
MSDNSEDWEFPETKSFWRCEECGYEDHRKPMPKGDRQSWYNKRKPATCLKCNSEALMPVGWG